MSVLKIITYPNAALKKQSEYVDTVDDEVRSLMDDMVDTMRSKSGVGLAAPQVGVLMRVIVLDVNVEEEDNYPIFTLANPEITGAEGAEEFEEGCLSLPGFTTMITRPSSVTVKALDREGKEITIEADGLLAIALQHEIDHLNGTLIIDKASPIKRQFYKKRIKKQTAKAG